MQTWKVELVPEAQNDFNTLDGSVRKQVLKQLIKLEQNPNYGDPLGNKAGINLDGYFKLYADKKQIRIIYEVVEDIIKVIAIDKREDMEVYLYEEPRNYTCKEGSGIECCSPLIPSLDKLRMNGLIPGQRQRCM